MTPLNSARSLPRKTTDTPFRIDYSQALEPRPQLLEDADPISGNISRAW